MLEWIIDHIICDEYHNAFRATNCTDAMKLSFHLRIDYEREEGYRNLELFLWSDSNYVGVFCRETWNVCDLNTRKATEGKSELRLLAFHDSCWRSDGVERFIFANSARFGGLSCLSHWYSRVNDPELIAEFKRLIRSW